MIFRKAQRDTAIREAKRVCQASERRGITPWRAVSKQMIGGGEESVSFLLHISVQHFGEKLVD